MWNLNLWRPRSESSGEGDMQQHCGRCDRTAGKGMQQTEKQAAIDCELAVSDSGGISRLVLANMPSSFE